jgi:hypothetical protein
MIDDANTNDTDVTDPWQVLERLGYGMEGTADIKALDGLEAAVAAFAGPSPTFEHNAVSRFLRALLDQLCDQAVRTARRALAARITQECAEPLGWLDDEIPF